MLAPMDDRFRGLRAATAAAVLEGPGRTAPALRQETARGSVPADLAPLVEKIRLHAWRITDEELAALRARYSEDELFELVVAASLGAADTRLRAGMRALE